MSKSNKVIARGYIDDIFNAKRVDLIETYLSADFSLRGFPYVGTGIYVDTTSGDKCVITHIQPEGPANGHLVTGDELLSVEDDNNSWNTYDEIKQTLWGHGLIGSKISFRVLRKGKTADVVMSRGLVKGYNVSFDLFKDSFKKYLLEEYPDLEAKINSLIQEDDLVAFSITMKGTDTEYNRQAVWTESGFYRFADGKIIEAWGDSNEYTRMKQLGYQIIPPST
jgi:predicted ester cyclase